MQKIYQALNQPNLFEEKLKNEETKKTEETEERILRVITTKTLRVFEKDIKSIWNNFVESKDKNLLISELDEFFIDNKIYNEIERETRTKVVEVIKREDIQLVCYQWFKSE